MTESCHCVVGSQITYIENSKCFIISDVLQHSVSIRYLSWKAVLDFQAETPLQMYRSLVDYPFGGIPFEYNNHSVTFQYYEVNKVALGVVNKINEDMILTLGPDIQIFIRLWRTLDLFVLLYRYRSIRSELSQ